MELQAIWREEPVYLFMAAVGTVLFLVRFLIMLLGGDGLQDSDVPDHASEIHHADSDVSFKLLTLQSAIAFMMAAGWAGLALKYESGFGSTGALALSVLIGAAVATLFSFAMFKMRRFNHVGHYDLEKAVGTLARVYRGIPEKGQGEGEIEVVVDGRQRLMRAVSSGAALSSFTSVRVVRINAQEEIAVVEPYAG